MSTTELPLSVAIRLAAAVLPSETLLRQATAALGGEGRVVASLVGNAVVLSGVWEPDVERGLELIRRAIGAELKTEQLRVAYRSENGRVLEPIMALEVVVPEDSMGTVVGDLNRRRGVVVGMSTAERCKITGEVPLAELSGYSAFLAGVTSRRGTATATFLKFMEAPHGSGPQPTEPASAALRA